MSLCNYHWTVDIESLNKEAHMLRMSGNFSYRSWLQMDNSRQWIDRCYYSREYFQMHKGIHRSDRSRRTQALKGKCMQLMSK
jgi:hypothetical protein